MAHTHHRLIAGCAGLGCIAGGAIAALLAGMGGLAIALIVVLVVAACAGLALSQWSLARCLQSEIESAEKKREGEQKRARAALLAFIDSLPHAVASVTPDGKVEMANARAAAFGMEAGNNVHASSEAWLKEIVSQAVATRDRAAPAAGRLLQRFDEGREAFFQPQAIPLIDGQGNLEGVTVVLADVTGARLAQETRANFMSSFSHELKTPMTSLQMSIYLLIDDAAERLTPRQLDLLKAAREDADRLHRLLEDVLAAARGKA